mmetsp:Transcript_26060/g.65500  ORF Transcript_26060/g.65500 Transcript_26060/m.65500 type:complete len:103 (-) Transcript_26060:523-831(-)
MMMMMMMMMITTWIRNMMMIKIKNQNEEVEDEDEEDDDGSAECTQRRQESSISPPVGQRTRVLALRGCFDCTAWFELTPSDDDAGLRLASLELHDCVAVLCL